MADYTVTITLTDNSDPNGPDNFNYAPGYLQVHPEDRVRFTCNRPFTVKFLYGSPFAVGGGFSQDAASTTPYGTIDKNAAIQPYHYTVSAANASSKIIVDGGCPTIDVV
jgi:hypothetical protein